MWVLFPFTSPTCFRNRVVVFNISRSLFILWWSFHWPPRLFFLISVGSCVQWNRFRLQKVYFLASSGRSSISSSSSSTTNNRTATTRPSEDLNNLDQTWQQSIKERTKNIQRTLIHSHFKYIFTSVNLTCLVSKSRDWLYTLHVKASSFVALFTYRLSSSHLFRFVLPSKLSLLRSHPTHTLLLSNKSSRGCTHQTQPRPVLLSRDLQPVCL